MDTGGRQDIAIDTCISTAVAANNLSKLCLCIPKMYVVKIGCAVADKLNFYGHFFFFLNYDQSRLYYQ